MNRFDKDFHGSDPASGRPFCSGYPDGIWMIGILVSLPSLCITLVMVIGAINAWKETNEIAVKIVSIITYATIALVTISFWASYVILIIRRSATIILFSVLLGALSLAGSIYSYIKYGMNPLGGIIAFTIFMVFAWYCKGLREDRIIGNIQAEQPEAA